MMSKQSKGNLRNDSISPVNYGKSEGDKNSLMDENMKEKMYCLTMIFVAPIIVAIGCVYLTLHLIFAGGNDEKK